MFSANKKILSEGIFKWNKKTLALSVDKLLAMLDFSRKNFKLQGQNCCYPWKGLVTKNIKALALMVEKL